MDKFESMKKALTVAGFSLAVILILYNIFTGAIIRKISVPGIFEIEFDPTRTDLKAKITPPSVEPGLPSAVEPDQFIQDYFTAINNRQYDQTWTMLSENFKRVKNPTGKEDYIGFWDSIDRVNIENSEIQNQTADTAVVIGDVFYTKRSGETARSKYKFTLLFDQKTKSWLIDSQE